MTQMWLSTSLTRVCSSLTQTGGTIRSDLMSIRTHTLETALGVYTVTTTTQQRVPLTLINVC